MATIPCEDWFTNTPSDRSSQACGLFVADGATPVPLKRRDVTARVHPVLGFCSVAEEQCYVSDADVSATFKFPLPPRAAVYKFGAVIGDREVVSEVKPLRQAEEEYTLAVEQQGHTATLLKADGPSGIVTVKVGNLEAMVECVVRIEYLRLLDSFSGTTEFVHTATWVPPYVHPSDVKRPDSAAALRATEPVFAEGRVTYTLSYCVEVHSGGGREIKMECSQDVQVR